MKILILFDTQDVYTTNFRMTLKIFNVKSICKTTNATYRLPSDATFKMQMALLPYHVISLPPFPPKILVPKNKN